MGVMSSQEFECNVKKYICTNGFRGCTYDMVLFVKNILESHFFVYVLIPFLFIYDMLLSPQGSFAYNPTTMTKSTCAAF